VRLPNLLPDETLFSRLVRGLTVLGLPRSSYLRSVLLNSRASVHPYLTCNLSLIAESTEESADLLYQEQTLFPLFAFYLRKYAKLIHDSALSSHNAFRHCQLVNFGEYETLTLKYCSLCAEEDIHNFGSTYWHKCHQIPGLQSCSHHRVYLNCFSLPSRPHVYEGLLPPSNSPSNVCTDSAFSFAQYSADMLKLISQEHQMYNGYNGVLSDKGFMTRQNNIRRQALAARIFQVAKQLGYAVSNLLPSSPNDFKYFSPLLVREPSQHPFKHLLLSYSLATLNTSNVACVRVKQSIEKRNRSSESRCRELLLEGLSLAKISKITKKSRCYIKSLALKENLPIRLNPRKITQEVKLIVLDLAKRGFHRKKIASLLKLSSGSVESIISSFPRLVEHRARCRFESRRRRHRVTILRYIEAHKILTRQQIKKNCGAAFFWLYHHERDWLNNILPAAKPPTAPGKAHSRKGLRTA